QQLVDSVGRLARLPIALQQKLSLEETEQSRSVFWIVFIHLGKVLQRTFRLIPQKRNEPEIVESRRIPRLQLQNLFIAALSLVEPLLFEVKTSQISVCLVVGRLQINGTLEMALGFLSLRLKFCNEPKENFSVGKLRIRLQSLLSRSTRLLPLPFLEVLAGLTKPANGFGSIHALEGSQECEHQKKENTNFHWLLSGKKLKSLNSSSRPPKVEEGWGEKFKTSAPHFLTHFFVSGEEPKSLFLAYLPLLLHLQKIKTLPP